MGYNARTEGNVVSPVNIIFAEKNPSPSRTERTIGKDITKCLAVCCYMLHNLAIVAFGRRLCTVDCDMLNRQAVFPVGFLAL